MLLAGKQNIASLKSSWCGRPFNSNPFAFSCDRTLVEILEIMISVMH
jgi:hypothetical protein